MIQLTRINHKPIVINSDLIEHIESTPDTVISLTTKQSFMVLEDVAEVVKRIVEFRRRITNPGVSDSKETVNPHGGRSAETNE